MSNPAPFDFGKFVPGFDFLQSLAQGASGSMAQLPKLSSWVAPTISVEELDKRIQELKTVQFWLEQNARALAATMQALEVQKMTLATLKGMNFSFGDVANVFKSGTTERASAARQTTTDAPSQAEPAPAPAPAQEPAPDATGQTVVDPLQWWGALTSQFQQIAANALKDASQGSLTTPPDGPPATAGRRRKPAATGKAAGSKSAAAPSTAKPSRSSRPSAGRKTPARSRTARRPAG